MTPTRLSSSAIAEGMDSFGKLINETTQIGITLLGTYSRLLQGTARDAPGQLMQSAQTTMDKIQKMGSKLHLGAQCDCHIPPPCWLPQPAGDVVSHVCPGGTAVVRLCVTNCGFTDRQITIDVPAGSGVLVTPASFLLTPLARTCATLSLAIPADAPAGQEKENIVWVRGCKVHYLRWTVISSSRGACTCHEVDVDDCQDYIHHWYDHFYCSHPCTNRSATGGK